MKKQEYDMDLKLNRSLFLSSFITAFVFIGIAIISRAISITHWLRILLNSNNSEYALSMCLKIIVHVLEVLFLATIVAIGIMSIRKTINKNHGGKVLMRFYSILMTGIGFIYLLNLLLTISTHRGRGVSFDWMLFISITVAIGAITLGIISFVLLSTRVSASKTLLLVTSFSFIIYYLFRFVLLLDSYPDYYAFVIIFYLLAIATQIVYAVALFLVSPFDDFKKKESDNLANIAANEKAEILFRFKLLMEQGLITPEEFEKEKKKLLGS